MAIQNFNKLGAEHFDSGFVRGYFNRANFVHLLEDLYLPRKVITNLGGNNLPMELSFYRGNVLSGSGGSYRGRDAGFQKVSSFDSERIGEVVQTTVDYKSRRAFAKLKNRFNRVFSTRVDNWLMVDDFYSGGLRHLYSPHLLSNKGESVEFYLKRLVTAFYTNDIKSISNILSGFVLKTNPVIDIERGQEIFGNDDYKGEDIFYTYVEDNVRFTQDKNFLTFIRELANRIQLYPSGFRIFVTDGRINVEYLDYKTVMDFIVDDDGVYQWIYLKTPHVISLSPFEEDILVDVHELITNNEIVRYYENLTSGAGGVFFCEKVENPFGFIPIYLSFSSDILYGSGQDNYAEEVVLASRSKYQAVSSVMHNLQSIGSPIVSLPTRHLDDFNKLKDGVSLREEPHILFPENASHQPLSLIHI